MKKLYHTLNRISNIIYRILTVLVIGVVLVNFGSVLLQVLNRYVIVKVSDISFHWTEEMARYSMIWMCYIAIPIVYREGNMAQLDLIYSRLGKKPKTVLYIITRILCMVFIILAVHFGIGVIRSRMMFKSSILRAPGYTLYSAPIFGCVLMGFEMVTEVVGVLAGELTPYTAGEERHFSFFDSGKGDDKA